MASIKRSGPRGLLLFLLGLLLGSCATSSGSYLKASTGYSIVPGRILRVENLAAKDFRHLSDGVAIPVAEDGCRVTLQLDKENEQTYEVGPGTILIFSKKDYLLRNQLPGQIPEPPVK